MAWIVVCSLLALIAINVPIGFALGITAVIAILIQGEVPLAIVPMMFFHGANKFVLLAIPLFMLTGELMNASGISKRIINFASSLVGFLRGGLAMVNVVANMFFAGISGSAIADVSALGSVLIPEMKRQGYPADFSTALTSAAASMAIIIPPSISFILYGALTDTSISALFLAGIIPGILLGFSMMIVVYLTAKKRDFKIYQPFSAAAVWKSFREALWGLAIPVVILGGILGGIFTATEAAGVSVLVAFFAGFFVYRTLNFKILLETLLVASKRTGMIMFIVATSVILAWYFTAEQIPQTIARHLTAVSSSYVVNILLINAFLLIVGMFLDGIAAIIMVVPILMPLLKALEVDLVHFGIVLSLNLAIGQQTPPVASVLLTACAISELPIEKIVGAMKHLLLIMVVVLLLVSFMPQIALFLPESFK